MVRVVLKKTWSFFIDLVELFLYNLLMRQDPILAALRRVSIIRHVDKIRFDKNLRLRLDPTLLREINSAQRHMVGYRFSYESNDHTVIGYLLLPRSRKELLPVIVYNRGGSGEFGAIRIGHLFSGTISGLVQGGYAVIASQYSGVAGGGGIDEMGGSDLQDVIALKQIVDESKICDPKNIGMYGFSRGGMMTYMLLKSVNWIRAAVVVGGPTDLFALEKFRPEMKAHFRKMFGGTGEEKTRRSVIKWYKEIPKTIPLLVLCGTSDERVNSKDTILFAAQVVSHLQHFKFILYPEGTHALSEHRSEVSQEILNWFNKVFR